MKLRTLTLAGVVALVAVPAFANDGREYRAIVMEGLKPAPVATVPLENRKAFFAPSIQGETIKVVRAKDVNGD